MNPIGIAELPPLSCPQWLSCASLQLKAAIMDAPRGEIARVMRSCRFQPREPALTSLLQACAKARQPGKALELFDAMPTLGLNPNVHHYS